MRTSRTARNSRTSSRAQHPEEAETRTQRMLSIVRRVVIVFCLVFNVVVLAPSVYFSILTGSYLPRITLIAVSICIWVLSYAIVTIVKNNRRRRAQISHRSTFLTHEQAARR